MAADRALAVEPVGDMSAADAEGFLDLRRLTKKFDDTLAVDDVSVSIRRGEFFALLGPSGCGKTTTMRCVAGFEEPTSGEVRIAGRGVTGLSPAERDTGMVFQNYALFPHYDVYRNVAYGLLMDRLNGGGASRKLSALGSLANSRLAHRQPEVRDEVAKALERVDLTGYERRKVSQLSGGQQQRVALARALVKRPSVLLMDEPLSNLDRKLRTQMRYMIRDIQQEVGITTIFVTHDQDEAMSMADRIALMRDGRIVQIAEPTQLYERPATPWAADFVGTSNLLPGTVAGRDDALTVVDVAGSTLRSEDAWGGGGTCEVLIRPEAFIVSRADSGSRADSMEPSVPAGNRIGGKVRHVGFLGAIVQYEVETRAGLVRAEHSFAGASSLMGIDEDVVLDVHPSRVRLLTPEAPS
ncbi:ABC transporter ATP-binding protein [Phytoactinopolyspora alkaliphila]|uniref:ABC transporter ATP-binding protein n=1 Tax=Phytoactinopolyspora alkaliphila TaxID=1783498 RepID=A0A6N9YSD8_9ACTN|nr:ABC transporter ATP-binding protein [Phytoactinopolyspora alkaliphila]NED97748.1 ABC transporter ATP-binding protein [Phytoactinopolyspora alkaliphila]